MKRFLLTFSLLHFYTLTLFAADCIAHKISPEINIIVPEWTHSVIQPDEPMDLHHGVVIATLAERYNMVVSAEPVIGGYCIVLNSVDATFGYTEFLIKIDSRHLPDSCEYNLTLEHEELHIAAHLSAADDAANDIRRSVTVAASSVMPIFVPSSDDIDSAMDRMQRVIQEHPDIILMKQKMDADQEIKNKKIDQRGDGRRINEC
ncbi:MAG: hypothetical protein FWF34_00015 [Alphaproteobacteria bacterium]|nr:hypothetical protein [Alphaproteobacteria bacterium]MCL2889634.1 hypothetical protein [Alphaproteobacteria bacterium]